jgi:hypothetical protein
MSTLALLLQTTGLDSTNVAQGAQKVTDLTQEIKVWD